MLQDHTGCLALKLIEDIQGSAGVLKVIVGHLLTMKLSG